MNEINIGDYILDKSNCFRLGKVFNINKELGLVHYEEYWEHKGKLLNNLHRSANLKDVFKFNSIATQLLRDSIKIIDMFLVENNYEETGGPSEGVWEEIGNLELCDSLYY